MDFDLSSVLGSERVIECTACGERNPLASNACAECGAVLKDEDYDHETLDLTSNSLGGSLTLTGAVRESDPRKNLRRLHEAVTGVQNGSLPLEGYRQRVDAVHRLISQGILAFNSPEYKQKVDSLPPLERDLTKHIHSSLIDYLAGLEQMRAYYTTLNVDDAVAGFAAASQSIQQLESVQDRAKAEVENLKTSS